LTSKENRELSPLFSKNSRDNIEGDEMKALKRLTRYYLTLKPSEIKTALQ
jgi:hypothetical protein